MKSLLSLSFFLAFSYTIIAQNKDITSPEIIDIHKSNKIEKIKKEELKPEDAEKLKKASSAPAVFYIINDKPVSREEYLRYLSEQERIKELNPNPKP